MGDPVVDFSFVGLLLVSFYIDPFLSFYVTKSFSVFGFRLVLTDPMLPLSRYSPVTDFASQLRTFFLFTDFRFSIMNLRYNTQLPVSKLLSLMFYTAFAHSYPLFYSEYIGHFL